MAEPKPSALLIDTDAVLSLDTWEELAQQRRWFELFSHIPEAEPRHDGLLDALELAAGDGVRVGYASRWPGVTLALIRDRLAELGYPEGYIQTRRSAHISPVDLAAIHAGEASRGRTPVLVVHHEDATAAALRQRGIAALTPAQLPGTVDGLRRVFALAKPAPRLLKPRPKTENDTTITKASVA